MEFVKLYDRLLRSTIWQEPSDTIKVWITLLLLCDADGDVLTSIPGLAHTAKVSLEACEAAIETFSQPDPYSTTPDNEGRRIVRIEGGFNVLNFKKYYVNQTKRQKFEADRKRERRDRVTVPESPTMSHDVPGTNQMSHDVPGTLRDTTGQIECPSLSQPVRIDKDKDKDKDLLLVEDSAAAKASEMEEFRLAWNRIAEECGLTQCRTITAGRAKSLRQRLKDPDWRKSYPEALERIRTIRWIRGNAQYPPRGIDWFIQSETLTKVLEGAYDDNKRDYSHSSPDDSAGLF